MKSVSNQTKKLVFSNPALTKLSSAHRVLLLQGPIGSFFKRLTELLEKNNKKTYKINFSGGDVVDYKSKNSIEFTGRIEEWPAFYRDKLSELKIDMVILFGQSRPYHKYAVEIANFLGIDIIVLEEGYFRPGFFTMELGGVNSNSDTLNSYELAADSVIPEAFNTGGSFHAFIRLGWLASKHYLMINLLRWKFPSYVHHKSILIIPQFTYWIISFSKKLIRYSKDYRTVNELAKGSYFFVPLQFDLDSQIKVHSDFVDNCEFIRHVLTSFVANAPAGHKLVFKLHPMSRGSGNQEAFLADLVAKLAISKDRVIFLVEGRAGTLVSNAKAVVTINSTVGLLALQHGVPLCVTGSAIYSNFSGVFKDRLDEFWTNCDSLKDQSVDNELKSLKSLTQMPGDLYAWASVPLEWVI